MTREPSKPRHQNYQPNSCDCLQAGTAIDRELPQFGPLAGCRRTPSSGVLVSWFSSSLSPSLHGLSPDSTLLRDNLTSLPTSLRCRCLPSELPGCPGSAEIAWSKTMHFPGFRSLLNEPLGILGVVFPSTQTRFILPYEASLTFRNPFCFRLPLHTSSRLMQTPSTRDCLPKSPQQTFTVEFIIMSNARDSAPPGDCSAAPSYAPPPLR